MKEEGEEVEDEELVAKLILKEAAEEEGMVTLEREANEGELLLVARKGLKEPSPTLDKAVDMPKIA